MSIELRKAELEDWDIVTDIYRQAIQEMNNKNIRQWDEIYPDDLILKEDILKKEMYVGIVDKTIVSAVVINREFDEDYRAGHWQSDCFAVVHRLCVHPAYQNKKIGRDTMSQVEVLLRSEGIRSIRLDTFSRNPYALNLYGVLGYEKVGEVNWRKGLFYLLEKQLDVKETL